MLQRSYPDLTVLQTGRLNLLSPNPKNVEAVYDSIENKEEYYRGLSVYHKTKNSILNAVHYWHCLEKTDEQHFIMQVKETGEYIGHIWYGNGNAIGYGLCEKARGNGYCLEALFKIMEYMFNEMGNKCLLLDICSWNLPSINIAKKAGFSELHRYMYVGNDGQVSGVISFVKFK